MAFRETYWYTVAGKIISITCALLTFLILSYHVIVGCKTINKQDSSNTPTKKRKKTKMMKIILYSCLICATVFNIIGCFEYIRFKFNSSSHTIHISCYILYLFGVSFYAVNKTLVYYSYLLRLDLSFEGSALQVKKHVLRRLYLATTIYFLIYIIAICFTDKTEFEWNDKYHICINTDPHIATWQGRITAISIILYECVISIRTLILFIKPLCNLATNDNDPYFHELIVKVGLLNSIIIISSVIGVIYYSITSSRLFLFIDNVINSLCLILMVNSHKKLYRRLCHCCISWEWCRHDHDQFMNTISHTTPISMSPHLSTNKSVTIITKSSSETRAT